MSKKRKHLSDAEIWDDSALIDSWNEALAEYKYYHSLHARGERVEDVLRDTDAAEAAEGAVQGGARDFVNGAEDGELENGEVNDAMGEEADEGEVYGQGEKEDDYEKPDEVYGEEGQGLENGYDASHDEQTPFNLASTRAPMMGPQIPAAPTMPLIADVPQAVLGSAQDEAMKNLMMSWYYAGYYTGFYEGQKQAGEGKGVEGKQQRKKS